MRGTTFSPDLGTVLEMCPLWPAHYFFMHMHIVVFAGIWLASFQIVGAAVKAVDGYNIKFEPAAVELLMDESVTIKTHAEGLGNGGEISKILYHSTDDSVMSANPEWENVSPSSGVKQGGSSTYTSTVNVTGDFIGRAEFCASLVDNSDKVITTKCMDVVVTRESRAVDKAFTYSVIVLVAIIYVNMGAALDIETVKKTLKRPIGPVIGFMCQFVLMPLLSYAVAKALIPSESLQLGLFITGCSPAGGASNIWTLTLGGNLDLSITMTTISTLSAFVMMPLYFGRLISNEAHLRIPNSKIATFCVSLFVPLAIGIFIKRKFSKIATFLIRILKPFAVFLILFIIVFAIYTNVYIFKLFNWQVRSKLLLYWADSLAIGIETGVQNTGLAIFVLRFSLDAPDSDLTTVMPVAVAIMTPVLPLMLLVVQKVLA